MAADGSVIIEIEGNASELISEFQRVSSSAENIESSVEQIADAFREATRAAEGLDGAGLDEAANAAEALDQGLTEASQAADQLENSLEGDISGELDQAADAADDLDDALDQAAQAADNLDDSAGSAGNGLGRLRDGFTTLKASVAGVISDLATRVVDAFLDLGKEALNSADALTKFGSTMEFAGFDSATIESSRAAVQDYASRTVYDLETVANTTAQLAANGVQDFVGLTEAAGNLNAVAGGNAETFQSVAMALTQTVGAGKLTTENWNQIADAIPGASGKLQEAMRQNGAFVGDFRDAMAEGQITAEEFQQAIMDLGMTDAAVEAASSVATIEGAVGNLKATIVDGITGVLTDGGGMEAITGFINGINDVLVSAGTYIGPAIESIKSSLSSVADHFRSTFSPEQQAAISEFVTKVAGLLLSLPFQLASTSVMVLAEAWKFLINVGAALGEIFQFLEDVIYAIFDPALSVSDAFSELGSKLSSIFFGAEDSAEQAAESVTSSFESMTDSAVQSTEEMASAVESGFSQLPESAQTGLDETLSTVDTWGSELQNSAQSAASGAAENVRSELEAIPSDASVSLGDTVDGVSEWGAEMTETATSAAEETAEGIEASLQSVVPEAESIGQDISAGLANGIRAGKSGVITAATEVASAALKAAKDKLEIHSPSVEFREEVGLQISRGMAEGILDGTEYVEDSMDTLVDITERHIKEKNEQIARIEQEATERQEKAELEAHEKALADLYKELEDAELDKRDEINEKIAKLEADWAEKQLKKQEEAQKKALESEIDAYEARIDAVEHMADAYSDALSEFSSEYESAMQDALSQYDSALNEIERERQGLQDKLGSFELFDDYEGDMHLWSLQPMIDQVNEYGDAIAALKEKGVSESLLDQILSYDRSTGLRFSKELLALSDAKFSDYMADWEELQEATAVISTDIYADDVAETKEEFAQIYTDIETEYAEKLPALLEETGAKAMEELAGSIDEYGAEAVQAAASVADQIIAEINRINAAQRLSAAVNSSVSAMSGALTSSAQSAEAGRAADRSAQAVETAGAISMVSSVTASREIVLNVNGKEFARATVDDIRAVEDQSPQIVSDTR